MRDINRIPRIIELLKKVWDVYPDMRFFQTLSSFKIPYKGDLFYLEDDEFEKFLQDYYKELMKHENKN